MLYNKLSVIEKSEWEKENKTKCTNQDLLLSPEDLKDELEKEANIDIYLYVKGEISAKSL
jgi:hypothetical protein